MVLDKKEMLRVAQVYVDSVYRVPVRVVDVKQVRVSKGMVGRFEIHLRGVDEGDSPDAGV